MENINIGEIDTVKWCYLWFISVKDTNKVEIDNAEMDLAKIAKVEKCGRGTTRWAPAGRLGRPLFIQSTSSS